MAKINQGYQKKTTETIYKPLRGLTSKRPVLAEPDTLVDCENFVFIYGDTLATRPALSVDAYIPNQETGLTNADFGLQFYTQTYDKPYFVFNRNKEIYIKDESLTNSYVQKLVTGATSYVFSSNNVKDAVIFKDAMYAVEGTTQILKWTGASHSVSYIDIPKTETYGNPVSICQTLGRLFVVTDKNYLRYSAVDSDIVWEDRVLMGGILSVTAGNRTIVGTSTTFEMVEGDTDERTPGIGVNITLTNGTSEYNLVIEAIESSTQMVVTTLPTVSGTFTWYLSGIDYYEPIETGDAKVLKFIRPFGNLLAITRGSKKGGTKGGGLTVLNPVVQENTNILLIAQRNITQSLNLFPYTLCEYENNLIFLSENGMYGIPAGNAFSKDSVELSPLSKDKIEHITKLLDISYERKIRMYKISNEKYNMLVIPYVRTSDIGEPKRFLTAFMTEGGFEFTELSFVYELQRLTATSQTIVNSCHGCGVVDGSLRLISDRYVLSCFKENSGLIDLAANDVFNYTADMISFITGGSFTADTTVKTADAGANLNGTAQNIYKYLKTGLTSNQNIDWMRIQKLYVFTAEAAAVEDEDTYTLQPYMIGSRFKNDEDTNLLTINKKYAYSMTVDGITIDTEPYTGSTDYTIDNDIVTIDSDSVSSTPIIKQHSYYINARSIPNIGLKITDNSSQGYMEIYGYGFSGLASKFV